MEVMQEVRGSYRIRLVADEASWSEVMVIVTRVDVCVVELCM
jgi:hypothetical protein